MATLKFMLMGCATHTATVSTVKSASFMFPTSVRIFGKKSTLGERERITDGASLKAASCIFLRIRHLTTTPDPSLSTTTMAAVRRLLAATRIAGRKLAGWREPISLQTFYHDKVMTFRFSKDTGITELTDRTAELISPTGITGRITSFGEDSSGNLYLVSHCGQIGMITSVPEPEVWAMMLAGFALVGACGRYREKKRGHINALSSAAAPNPAIETPSVGRMSR
jgi:hypothetical protein